ncbi:MAG: hypothetical protein WAP52_02170 [Candidatus Sungiibacteriota bacterium]
MAKFLQLKLVKIKYGGDSIGDDIRIEIDCLNQVFRMDKKIQNGTEAALNAEIGQFTIDQESSQLSMSIKIIEQDLVFNDIGSKEVKMNVDLRNTSPQTITYDISVKELRGLVSGQKTAVFSLTVEILIVSIIHYIPDTTDDGLLKIIREDNKKEEGLPMYLKVRFDRIEAKREYFTIMEGALRGVKASVTLDGQNQSYLISKNSQTGTVSLKYSIAEKTLHFKNEAYATTDDPKMRWKKGLYDVEIPDMPHAGGLHYLEARYAKIWFRVGHTGKRYIHTGKHSAGCITLLKQNRWDDLCIILAKARKGDGKSIGVLEVVD